MRWCFLLIQIINFWRRSWNLNDMSKRVSFIGSLNFHGSSSCPWARSVLEYYRYLPEKVSSHPELRNHICFEHYLRQLGRLRSNNGSKPALCLYLINSYHLCNLGIFNCNVTVAQGRFGAMNKQKMIGLWRTIDIRVHNTCLCLEAICKFANFVICSDLDLWKYVPRCYARTWMINSNNFSKLNVTSNISCHNIPQHWQWKLKKQYFLAYIPWNSSALPHHTALIYFWIGWFFCW